jgi:large subunit ribosomal protein L15
MNMLQLNKIRKHPGATQKPKRRGRGQGSGLGATAGKGDKGQLARSGGHVRPGFEGGQMPLFRRMPKVGFKNIHRRTSHIMNLFDLEKLDSNLKEVSLEALTAAKAIKGRYDRLVVLGTGELKKALKIRAHRVSESAKAAIEKAGGSVELIAIPGAQKRNTRKNAESKTAEKSSAKAAK